MSRAKRAVNATEPIPTERVAEEVLELNDAKNRADKLGCFMQMFVAYNPDTEVFVFASNDPCVHQGKPSEEALLLAALVVEHLADVANPAKPESKIH